MNQPSVRGSKYVVWTQQNKACNGTKGCRGKLELKSQRWILDTARQKDYLRKKKARTPTCSTWRRGSDLVTRKARSEAARNGRDYRVVNQAGNTEVPDHPRGPDRLLPHYATPKACSRAPPPSRYPGNTSRERREHNRRLDGRARNRQMMLLKISTR